jgi:AmiR/NasT family two-component response regulator
MTVEVWRALLTNIPVVGVAQGVLMERFDLTADQAFERLWRMSQSDPTKALEVALAVVNSSG